MEYKKYSIGKVSTEGLLHLNSFLSSYVSASPLHVSHHTHQSSITSQQLFWMKLKVMQKLLTNEITYSRSVSVSQQQWGRSCICNVLFTIHRITLPLVVTWEFHIHTAYTELLLCSFWRIFLRNLYFFVLIGTWNRLIYVCLHHFQQFVYFV